jgi:hypothetical protein
MGGGFLGCLFRPQRYHQSNGGGNGVSSCDTWRAPPSEYASLSAASGSFAGPTGATADVVSPLLLLVSGSNARDQQHQHHQQQQQQPPQFAIVTVSSPDDGLLLPSNGDYLLTLTANLWFKSIVPNQTCTFSLTPQIVGQTASQTRASSTSLTVLTNTADQMALSTIVVASNGTPAQPPILRLAFTQSQPVAYNALNPSGYGAYLSNINITLQRL